MSNERRGPSRPLSRRLFLAGTGVVVATAAGFVAFRRCARYPEALELGGPARVLGPMECAVLTAAGARMLPEGAGVDLGSIDTYLARLAEWQRGDLLKFLGYLEYVAPLAAGVLSRFSMGNPLEQQRVLEGLEASRFGALRAGFQGVKGLLMLSYYREARSWTALGYSGPVVVWGN